MGRGGAFTESSLGPAASSGIESGAAPGIGPGVSGPPMDRATHGDGNKD